jgi:hypothetical protein
MYEFNLGSKVSLLGACIKSDLSHINVYGFGLHGAQSWFGLIRVLLYFFYNDISNILTRKRNKEVTKVNLKRKYYFSMMGKDSFLNIDYKGWLEFDNFPCCFLSFLLQDFCIQNGDYERLFRRDILATFLLIF